MEDIRTRQENMIEPEIPNRSERLSVGDKGAECSSQGAADAIIP